MENLTKKERNNRQAEKYIDNHTSKFTARKEENSAIRHKINSLFENKILGKNCHNIRHLKRQFEKLRLKNCIYNMFYKKL